MAETVYILCAITSVICAILLIRNYLATRARLLLWASLCFVGLAINNILLFTDLVLLSDRIDLSIWRSAVAVAAVALLLFGLIWEAES